ncbi:DUF2470 domain-containing protein [Streptomyces sp. NPDC055709]
MPWDSPTARAAAYAQDDDLTCVMEITDVAPVAVRQRIRGRAWLAGWLTAVRNEDRHRYRELLAERHPVRAVLESDAEHPSWMLVRLETGEISVDDLWGTGCVEPDDLGRTEPDPVARHEAELLQHLHSTHADQVRGLATLLGDRKGKASAAAHDVVPLALDRFGLRVRITEKKGGRAFDARFDFPEPVRDTGELRQAMHTLFSAAMG